MSSGDFSPIQNGPRSGTTTGFLLDLFLKKVEFNFILCTYTCYCGNMLSVTSASRYIMSASRYHPRYQSRSSMYIRGLIPRNWPRQFRLERFLSELSSNYVVKLVNDL